MQRRADLTWIVIGIVAALVTAWAFPRAFPLYPDQWSVSSSEAEAIALERLRDLGDLPDDPYVITRVDTRPVLEARLQEMLQHLDVDQVRESILGRNLIAWEVVLYSRTGRSFEWTRRVRITTSGEVSDLRLRVPPDEERPTIDEAEARARADRFLDEQGFDVASLGEPEVRSRQLQSRTDITLRYRDHSDELGEELDHGVEVSFAGDQLTGFNRYFEEPERVALQATLQSITLIQQAWVFLPILLLPIVAVPFVRRYHAGEIGVKRGLHIFALIVACGAVTMLFCAHVIGADVNIGPLSRPQISWVVAFQFMALIFVPMGLLAFLSWSVGESLSREKSPFRLAAFDALFQGEWLNTTFARSVLRGFSSGLALIAVNLVVAALMRSQGAWASTSFSFGDWWSGTSWFSIPLLTLSLTFTLYAGLFGRLFLASYLEAKARRWVGGTLAAVIGTLIFFPLIIVFPITWSPLLWLVMGTALVVVFFRYGILASIMAQTTAVVVASAGPILGSEDPGMQLQAVIALLVVALPLLVSLRFLWSDRKFFYRYEDIPPHVRRIAERERQKVELETARRIQSSILPELPPQINGVEMSHSYIPATEVGGDFYDVLALEDGRVAVAVGDVAGHGVSSGLVMSMAKSALAVQVSFNPEVAAVFTTLNRLVYQSARKRLLTTLCYAVLDPRQREMFFASAGHLFPYRITGSGEVVALESVSYPLGVRDEIEVRVRGAKLEAGDYLFMFSDGVVEARRENSDEMFGFERLERSLKSHAGGSVHDLRRGVLEDLERFAGNGPRDDDLTVLALRIA